MRSGLGALLASFTFAGCLAENPSDESGGATSGETTDDTSATDTTSTPVSDNMIGCPSGETCWVVLVAEALDDRVEIFGAPAGTTPAYRGAIDLDLKPGTDVGPLDEPFGMVLSATGLHVITGHYPETALGSLITFPSAFFDGREPSLIPVDEYFASGAGVFSEGVIETRLGELEPIFALPRVVSGKLLIGVFANNLFAAEETWTEAGKLAIVDASDPSSFAMATLTGLEGGDCLGASEIITLGDDQTAAVACDGNEAVAFLDLGDLSASVGDVADGVTGTLCDLPYPDGRRSRYLAHDGNGGVLIGVGPSPTNATASQVWSVTPDCMLSPIDIADSDGLLGQIVPFGQGYWLLAQGALAPNGERGVKVLSGSSGVCNTLPGLDGVWDTDGVPISPYALAVSPDENHLLIGAGATQLGNPQQASYGKVVWATLSGTEDPCTMTASPVDLTDGGAGHAPAPSAPDPKTWRRAPNVVVIAEVEGA